MQDIVIGKIDGDRLHLNTQLTEHDFIGKQLPVIKQLPPSLIVNLAALKKCDSVGIAALVWLLQSADRLNCQIIWQNIPAYINKILTLYKLNTEGLIQDARNID